MKCLPCILVLGAALAWPVADVLAAASETASDGHSLSDRALTMYVEIHLAGDPAIPFHRLDVRTDDGIVTLTGSVRSLLLKERAGEIAGSLRGVRAVVNRIDVRPTSRPDAQISEDVQQALAGNPATQGMDVTVRARDGAVTLTGKADGWAERQLAERVAKGVPGVREVRTELTIVYRGDRSDDEIKHEVEGRLASDVWVDKTFIDVQVKGGTVSLSGLVGSAEEKGRAERLAHVSGVKDVDDAALEVVAWDQSRRRPDKYAARADEDVRHAVEDALRYDPRVSADTIAVNVSRGYVILSGVARTMAAKLAAEQDARDTVGAWRVINRIRVQAPEAVSDQELTRRVEEAIRRNPVLDGYEIAVAVRDGRAVLTGFVESSFEKTQAEDAAASVTGVTGVTDRLKLLTRSHRRDEEIWSNIKRALWWSPRLYDKPIRVTVEDGTAILTGTVDTIQESRLAAEKALESGAESVRNRLTVRFSPWFRSAGMRHAPEAS